MKKVNLTDDTVMRRFDTTHPQGYVRRGSNLSQQTLRQTFSNSSDLEMEPERGAFEVQLMTGCAPKC